MVAEFTINALRALNDYCKKDPKEGALIVNDIFNIIQIEAKKEPIPENTKPCDGAYIGFNRCIEYTISANKEAVTFTRIGDPADLVFDTKLIEEGE